MSQLTELKFRAVFVSDIHLGSTKCQAEKARAFLHAVQCEKLYLVGDIIDLWVSKRQGKWTQDHTNVIRTILGKSKRGCQVYLTPGNHDSDLRRLNGLEFGNILIEHEFTHETAEGKKYLVVHGDFFDKSVTTLKPLAVVASWAYEGLSNVNKIANKARNASGKDSTDFSGNAKKNMKRAISYFTQFPDRITVDAKNRGFDGVICGHIHRPSFEYHDCDAWYINIGDWMENCTALVEHFDGRMELIYFDNIPKELLIRTNMLAAGTTSDN